LYVEDRALIAMLMLMHFVLRHPSSNSSTLIADLHTAWCCEKRGAPYWRSHLGPSPAEKSLDRLCHSNNSTDVCL